MVKINIIIYVCYTTYIFLSVVPSSSNALFLIVGFNTAVHFLFHRVTDLLSEHIAKNASHQHHHEDYENDDKVLNTQEPAISE